MNFNEHLELQGKHAIFSPSSSSWLRYDDDKTIATYVNRNRKALGTEIHEYAQTQIELLQKVTSIKALINDIATHIYIKYKVQELPLYGKSLVFSLKELPDEIFDTVKLFINDAIGYKMNSEVPLSYSTRFFGTTDAISFRNNLLRIHDLKTGDAEAHVEQLVVYAALFCLEYKIKPSTIQIELRVYQFGKAICYEPGIDEIIPVMDKIVTNEKLLTPRIENEEN